MGPDNNYCNACGREDSPKQSRRLTKLTMTLWNAINEEPLFDMEQVIETTRVPLREERIDNLWAATRQNPAGYKTWVVTRVTWTFHSDRQHAVVRLVLEIS